MRMHDLSLADRRITDLIGLLREIVLPLCLLFPSFSPSSLHLPIDPDPGRGLSIITPGSCVRSIPESIGFLSASRSACSALIEVDLDSGDLTNIKRLTAKLPRHPGVLAVA